MSLAEHPRALWALAAIAFIEASIFPIPPDVLLIPMIIAAPRRAWLYATVATVFSVLGGLAGYAIGAFAYAQLGEPILLALGKADAMASFAQRFNDAGFWTVLTAGLTPFPFKVITILSGATGMSLPLFIGTAILARAARFFLVALLLWKFGAPIRVFIEKYLGWVALAGIFILLGGFFAVKYL
jgi:membrane protein YqaA with SNARE-associated domain